MKKLFLTAALAAMAMVSCDKGPAASSEGDTRVVVKISGAQPSTRMTGTAATTSTAPALDAAYVYVLDTDGDVVWKEDLDVLAAQGAGHMIGDGERFSPDVRIFVIGNYPLPDVVPANLNSWTDIQNATTLAANNVNYLRPAMSNYNTDTKSSVPVNIIANADEGTATVNVPISPLYSRIELHQVKGGAHVVSFDVAAVYLNNYYPKFTMTGVGKEKYEHVDGSTNFTGVLGDVGPWVATATTPNTANTAIAKPDATKVWAYHTGAGSVATFIVKLTDIKILEVLTPASDENPEEELATEPSTPIDPETGDEMIEAYIAVTGYKNLSTNGFERGMIYTISSLEFDHAQLSVTPPLDPLVTIEANVTITPWGTKTLDPEM